MRFQYFIFVVIFLAKAQITFAKNDRPNILWLVIEDTSPQYIGCYGNTIVNTPNIDRLAAGGVCFSNAYSTGTVCSPSRSTIITGVKTYKMGTGNHRSNFSIPDFIKGFPAFLKQSGYYTSNNSKTDYNTADARRIIAESWHESSNTAGWWKKVKGQPFFSVFNFAASHQSRTMTNPYSLYQKQVLEHLPDSLKVGDDEFEMPPFYRNTPEMRKQVARIYNGVSLADYRIGKILNRLEKDRLMDSTIIFFYADHGEGMPRGKSNGIGQGYKVPFVVWFPEMYKHLSPWGTSGVFTEEHICFADLAPTILSLAGVAAPDYFDGRAFLGEQRKEAEEYLFVSNDRCENSFNLDRAVIKNHLLYVRNFTPYSEQLRWIHYFMYGTISRLIVDDFNAGKLSAEQAIVMTPRATEYLFDLSSDPWEMHNLIDKPEHKRDLAKMRKALEKNIAKDKDVLFSTEYELKQLPKAITPYAYRLSHGYNFKQIWKAAKYAGFRDDKSKRRAIKQLHSPSQTARLWAAIGLKSHTAFNESEIAQISQHLHDSYPPVQIFLASIIYDANRNAEARKILERYLNSLDPELSLMVLHNLHYMHNKEDFGELVEKNYKKMKAQKKGLASAINSAQVLLYRIKDRDLEMEAFW